MTPPLESAELLIMFKLANFNPATFLYTYKIPPLHLAWLFVKFEFVISKLVTESKYITPPPRYPSFERELLKLILSIFTLEAAPEA